MFSEVYLHLKIMCVYHWESEHENGNMGERGQVDKPPLNFFHLIRNLI